MPDYIEDIPTQKPAEKSEIEAVVSCPISAKYSDNYTTDDSGQRWVKLQYAQTYADKVSRTENQLQEVMDEVRRLRSLEDSNDSEADVLAELFLGLNKLCGN